LGESEEQKATATEGIDRPESWEGKKEVDESEAKRG
jgi:hypothetical protein